MDSPLLTPDAEIASGAQSPISLDSSTCTSPPGTPSYGIGQFDTPLIHNESYLSGNWPPINGRHRSGSTSPYLGDTPDFHFRRSSDAHPKVSSKESAVEQGFFLSSSRSSPSAHNDAYIYDLHARITSSGGLEVSDFPYSRARSPYTDEYSPDHLSPLNSSDWWPRPGTKSYNQLHSNSSVSSLMDRLDPQSRCSSVSSGSVPHRDFAHELDERLSAEEDITDHNSRLSAPSTPTRSVSSHHSRRHSSSRPPASNAAAEPISGTDTDMDVIEGVASSGDIINDAVDLGIAKDEDVSISGNTRPEEHRSHTHVKSLRSLLGFDKSNSESSVPV